MAGFGAVTFAVRATSQDRSVGADVTVQHIPGSDSSYVDIGGQGPLYVNLSLRIASDADYASLEALVGTQASLVSFDQTYSNAFLQSLRRTYRAPSQLTLADAVFIIPQ